MATKAPVTAAPTHKEGRIFLGRSATKGMAPSTKKLSPIIYAAIFAPRKFSLNFLGNSVQATAQLVAITMALQPQEAMTTDGTVPPSAAVSVATENRYAVLLMGPPRSSASIPPITAPSSAAFVPLRPDRKSVSALLTGATTELIASMARLVNARPSIGNNSSVLIPSRDRGIPAVNFFRPRMI